MCDARWMEETRALDYLHLLLRTTLVGRHTELVSYSLSTSSHTTLNTVHRPQVHLSHSLFRWYLPVNLYFLVRIIEENVEHVWLLLVSIDKTQRKDYSHNSHVKY